jgi:hypothetical protein
MAPYYPFANELRTNEASVISTVIQTDRHAAAMKSDRRMKSE